MWQRRRQCLTNPAENFSLPAGFVYNACSGFPLRLGGLQGELVTHQGWESC